ncbi:MAG: TM2 domain-containing protein [Kordiimonadaceae bacterium]|nr:TM2 domain-containing protein [Kordiimonadaceae bacterium]
MQAAVLACSACNPENSLGVSDKSYGLAVVLCGVFGVLGVHHFYLRNWFHGLIDLVLSVVGFYCVFFVVDPVFQIFGALLLILDVIHTVVIMYRLFVGKCYDGDGALVTFPGQVR